MLSGKGNYPSICSQKDNLQVISQENLSPLPNHLKELEFFKKMSPKNIVAEVKDHLMNPLFEKGDYVGGIILENPFECQHEPCLIQKPNGAWFVRKFVRLDQQLIIYGTQLEKKSDGLEILPLEKIKKVAKVVWLRKPYEAED